MPPTMLINSLESIRRRVRTLSVVFGIGMTKGHPEFVLFVNDPKLLGETYRRYLTARIREIQPYPGLPIILRARPRSSSPRK